MDSERIRDAAVGLLDFGRERLRDYALAESPTGDAAALDACARLIEAGHAEAGGATRRVPGPAGDHLVTTWGPEDGPYVVLLGHYDTVWPVGRLDQMPYTDDGTRIAGPGTYDMKAGLVAVEMAMRALAEAGAGPALSVRAVVVADEEVGSPDGRTVVEREVTGAAAVFGLEPPHPGGALKTGRKGSTRVKIKVTGREAHAALDPDKGVHAIDELIDQLAAARAAVPEDGSTMYNVGRIEGGTRANVIAGEAWAEIGLRFATPEAEAAVLGAITAPRPVREGAEVRAEILSSRPAWAPPETNPLLEAVAAAGREVGQAVTGRPASGAGDTNYTGALGVPTLDGFGPDGQGAHAASEGIVVASLAERAALLAALLATGV
ncbi:MAG: M20/M25/M40 family metallo-hydrolase [Streptosporangiales bacterium]|nr:M20/M25/M40 family metallo-hydrolase [Streptosporangiales bacterium]